MNLHPVIIPLHLFAQDEVVEDMFPQGIPHQIALLRQLYGLDQAPRQGVDAQLLPLIHAQVVDILFDGIRQFVLLLDPLEPRR